MRLIAVALVFVACAATALAQENVLQPDVAPSVPIASSAPAHDMSRICSPTSNERRRFYPERAQQRNLSGEAILDCSVNADHTLGSCQIVEESPSGFGFGESALGLACLWRLSDTSAGFYQADGERRIRRPVRFRLN